MATGIDYGMGRTNIDKKTGIRYGVIHQNEVLQAWCDSSEPNYGSVIDPGDFDEPIGFILDDGEYQATSDDYGDIFVIRSPYYAKCQFCSPCAPGAGYLVNSGDVKAYCFGHDWFEGGVAPYKVYSVATGEEVPA